MRKMTMVTGNITGSNRRAALTAMVAAAAAVGVNLEPSADELGDEKIAARIADRRSRTRTALDAAIVQTVESGSAAPATLVSDFTPSLTAFDRAFPARNAGFRQMFQAGHGWFHAGSGSTVNPDDTTRHWLGSQCATVTIDPTGTITRLSRSNLSLPDMSGKALRLRIKIDRPDLVSQVNLLLGPGGLTNVYTYRIQHAIWGADEPVEVLAPFYRPTSAKGALTLDANHNPSISAGHEMIVVEVIAKRGRTENVRWSLQSVEVVEQSNAFPRGCVTITFDDNLSSAHELARPIMDEYGFAGTHYVIMQTVGEPTRMTEQDLDDAYRLSGWEIACHSRYSATHSGTRALGFEDVTAAELEADLAGARQWLLSRGYSADSLAYPKGRAKLTIDGRPIKRIVERYFQTGRLIGGNPAEPPPAPTAVYAMTGIGEAGPPQGTPAALTSPGSLIDTVRNGGGWLVLVFHRITTEPATISENCSVVGFRQIMAYLAASGVEVLPMNQAYARMIAAST